MGSGRKSPLGTGQVEPGLKVSTTEMTGSCPSVPSSELFLIPIGGEFKVSGLLVFPGDSPAGSRSYQSSDTKGSTPCLSTPNYLPSLDKMHMGVGCGYITGGLGSLGGYPKHRHPGLEVVAFPANMFPCSM